jgi:AcrR family transcriptional regulator
MEPSKKEKIIRHAAELFAKQGFEGTTIRQIATKAGVATGLLYSYYDNKEDLLRTIFLEGLSEVRRAYEKLANQPSGTIISSVVRQSLKLIKNHQEFWRLFYAVRMQPAVLRSIELDLSEWTGYVMSELTRYFKTAGAHDPAARAHILYSMLDGVSQHYVMAPSAYPVEEAIALFEETFSLEAD